MNTFDREKIKLLCDGENDRYQRHINRLLADIGQGKCDVARALWNMAGYVEYNTLFVVEDYLEVQP